MVSFPRVSPSTTGQGVGRSVCLVEVDHSDPGLHLVRRPFSDDPGWTGAPGVDWGRVLPGGWVVPPDTRGPAGEERNVREPAW